MWLSLWISFFFLIDQHIGFEYKSAGCKKERGGKKKSVIFWVFLNGTVTQSLSIRLPVKVHVAVSARCVTSSGSFEFCRASYTEMTFIQTVEWLWPETMGWIHTVFGLSFFWNKIANLERLLGCSFKKKTKQQEKNQVTITTAILAIMLPRYRFFSPWSWVLKYHDKHCD